jgi:hypothetical protein
MGNRGRWAGLLWNVREREGYPDPHFDMRDETTWVLIGQNRCGAKRSEEGVVAYQWGGYARERVGPSMELRKGGHVWWVEQSGEVRGRGEREIASGGVRELRERESHQEKKERKRKERKIGVIIGSHLTTFVCTSVWRVALEFWGWGLTKTVISRISLIWHYHWWAKTKSV